MEILIYLKKIIPFILFLFLVVDGCNEAIAPDLNNKNDPNAVSFQGELPSDLKLTTLSDNAIKLEWKDNSNYEAGYTIERSINNENNFVEIGKVGPNVTSFIDSNAVVYDSYTYRVRISNVKTNVTAEISSEPYTEKIKMASNVGNFCLSPNGHYIAISSNQMTTVLNVSDGRELFSYPLGNYAISNDYIAVASTYTAFDDKRVINIWKITDGSLLTSFKTTGQVDGMAFNHSENILAIGDFITLSIWNIKGVPSPTVENHQDMSGFWYLEFSEDDKYLMAFQNSTRPSFTIYNINPWQAVYSKEIPNKTFPHFINGDVVFYLDNSFIFYGIKQGNNISTIEDTLDYGYGAFPEFKVNINKSGSILSAYNYSNKIEWLLTNYVVKIDLWLLNEHNLLKKIKTFDLGNELPTTNAFSSRNDFIVLTDSNNLYLWKYY